jgi:outer membrane receptor protein involved in Fe transport
MLLRLSTLALAFSTLATGQLTRGFVSGVVQDSTGSVVAGAKVKLTNKQTNISAEQDTNSEGVYRFVAVEIGTYSLEVTASGFETSRVENFYVGAAQEVVLNRTLTVGSTTTVVEVAAESASVELQRSSATIGNKITQETIRALPIGGATRDINVLALFTPTATRAPGSTGISANGQRARNNNFMLDGVDNNDPSVTIANSRVIPEAVEEFQVQVNPYSTEYGRNSGGQIMVNTRRGSNRFTGEVWNYYSANWMEPVSIANKRVGINETPRYNRNQAGGAIGGPIVKDRTFFFGMIEANRFRQAPDARNAASVVIPTLEGFNMLPSIPLGAGQPAQSRQEVLNALGFLQEFYPRVLNYDNPRLVNINGVNVPFGTVRFPLANPENFWYYQGRVDHQLTPNDSIGYRIQVDKRDQPNVTSNLGFGTKFAAGQAILGQNHAFNWTKVISPTVINEMRAAFVRRDLNFPENDPTSPTTGISGFFTIGGLSNFPQGRLQNTGQLQNVSTFIQGKHSIKIGADYRYTSLFNNSAFDSKGTWVFNNFADFMNNQAFSLTRAVTVASFDARQYNIFLFAQDDWKVTKDFTLNFGLRYEFSNVPFGFFGTNDPARFLARIPFEVRPDYNNFAPRAGFAWSPSGKFWGDGKTVFRGGYGLGYDVLFFNILTVMTNPRVVIAQQNNVNHVFPTLPALSATPPPFNPLSQFVNSNTDMQNPTNHYWSFSMQRQLASNLLIELGYSGNRSYHGIRQGRGNPAILTRAQADAVLATGNPNAAGSIQSRREDPTVGSRILIESTAKAEYHAGYAQVTRRYSNGLSFGGTYTFSSNFSDNDESLGVGAITASSPQIPQDWRNYRNEWSRSVFDRPHRVAGYWTYATQYFKTRNWFLRNVVGNWEFSGFHDFQSGQPFTIRVGADVAGNETPAAVRPNYNPAGTITFDPVTGNYRSFTTPLNGTGIVVTPLTATGAPLPNSMPGGGNLGRNTFRGPGFVNSNLSAVKRFDVTERWKLELRGIFSNVLNQRNWENPNAQMNSPAFGTNTSAPAVRNILLNAKILF